MSNMNISKLLRSGILAKISYMFGIALIIASLAVNAIPPKEVNACAVYITAVTECVSSDGTVKITWTVENYHGVTATISDINRGSIDGLSNGTTIGAWQKKNGTETVTGAYGSTV